jgi:hypothetical protein
LFFLQRYKVVEDDREARAFKVQTLSYEYNIERKKDRKEIVCFHREGEDSKNPITHIHVGSTVLADHSPFSNKAHVPSGRVYLEDLVAFLIKELKVHRTKKRKHDCASVIAKARAIFHRIKRWYR